MYDKGCKFALKVQNHHKGMNMSVQKSVKHILASTATAGLLTAAIKGVSKLAGKSLGTKASLGLFAGALGVATFVSMPAYAISESAVNQYAAAMNGAANNQNIGQVARLIADDAIISITSHGKNSSLDKNAYLQLLQKSWAKAKNYKYHISISDVVIAGGQARAQVVTTETWTEGTRTVKVVTSSRATLSQVNGQAVLLRSVAQVTVD